MKNDFKSTYRLMRIARNNKQSLLEERHRLERAGMLHVQEAWSSLLKREGLMLPTTNQQRMHRDISDRPPEQLITFIVYLLRGGEWKE